MKFSEKGATMAAMDKDLLDLLNDLHQALKSSGVERTAGLKEAMGADCAYYRKSKDLFVTNHFDKVRDIFLLTLEEYRKVEGNQFGR